MARTPNSRPPRFYLELSRISREGADVNLVLLWNYIDTWSRAAHTGDVRSRLDELLPLAEQNDGLVTASQARAIGILDSVLARLTQRGKLERVARCLSNPLLSRRSAFAIPGSGLMGALEPWTRRYRALSRNRIGRVWDLRRESVAGPYYSPQRRKTPAPEAEVDRDSSRRLGTDRCDHARRPTSHDRGKKCVACSERNRQVGTRSASNQRCAQGRIHQRGGSEATYAPTQRASSWRCKDASS